MTTRSKSNTRERSDRLSRARELATMLSLLGLLANCNVLPDEHVASTQAAVITASSPTTYALASGAIPAGITVTGGTAPYTCAITKNNSGGASCSMSGTTLSYTAGSYAGYNIKSQRSNDFLRLVSASGGPYVETGGVVGTTADLFKLATSGTGWTFQAKSNGLYVRAAGTVSTGNDLVADASAGAADVFLQQLCNGTGDPGLYNRFGYKSAAGTAPYWQAQSTAYVDTVNAGNGAACSKTSSVAWEAFYLVPGIDTLTITDAASAAATVVVSVENPVAFLPASSSAYKSGAMSGVQAWGGNGTFTGGSAGCAVTTNASGSSGGCAVTGDGAVTYTAGASAGTDVIRITDSQGHTGSFNVVVTAPFALSTATSYAMVSGALGGAVTVSGGATPYTCNITTNTSGGASCSVTSGSVSYTVGATAGYNLKSQRSGDYLRLVTASGGPYLQTGGAVGSSAELFKIAASGAGYTFQAVSTGLYLHSAGTVSTGNNLVANVAAGSADVYTQQSCNGTGDPGLYNRFGFKSAAGASPYWKVTNSPYVDTVNNGNGSACSPSNSAAYEGFYLVPGVDSLTVSDSLGHTSILTVSVESPITFLPSSSTVGTAAAMPTVQTSGGSGIFTGGSAGCAVTTNNSGGGTCTVTGDGAVSYTTGSSFGTDTLTVTDNQGHTGTFKVDVTLNFTQVSASKNYFACGTVSDGTARCWGQNDKGQLGNNSQTNSSAPVTVSGLSGASAVAASGYSACALLTNGTAKCWGENEFGQLGDGSTTDHFTPSAAVSGVANATAIGSGLNYTCALISDGTVSCWGDDTWGQIGDGVGGAAYPQTTAAVTVANVTGATAISVGSFHACALVAGGAIKCWGDGTMGQLGNGSSVVSWDAVTVTGISGATSIAAGEASSCAVLSDSTVKCWGDESYGQLGNGVASMSAFSSVPVAVPFLTGVSSVTVGYPFACARLTDNSVSCWGRNVEGELGDTTSTDRAYATPVAGLSTTSSISAGGHFVCSVLASGLTMCWGYNPYGGLGNSSTTDSHQAVPVSFGCTSCGLPDVTVGSLSYSPTSVAAGGTVTFSAVAWNQGVGPTPNGTIQGMSFLIDGAQVNFSSTNTTGLARGGSVTLTSNWGPNSTSTWTTTSGLHTLQGYADDIDRFAESNENNNTLTVNMSVGIDLKIVSLGWTPAFPASGSAVTFSAVVKNVGTVATAGGTIVGVRFDVDGVSTTRSDNYTTSLAAGASVTLTANSGPGNVSIWSATSGAHTIQAWVDDVNRFTDVDRTNNKLTRALPVP